MKRPATQQQNNSKTASNATTTDDRRPTTTTSHHDHIPGRIELSLSTLVATTMGRRSSIRHAIGCLFLVSAAAGGTNHHDQREKQPRNKRLLRHKRLLSPGERNGSGADIYSVVTPRIVDGTTASKDEYPFFVALVNDGWFDFSDTLVCGGTLIANNLVLSAGHCVEGNKATTVRVGAYTKVSSYGNGGQRYHDSAIEGYVRHPRYDSDTLSYDFLILKLSEPVTDPYLLNSIVKLDIDNQVNLQDGDTLTAVGLGFLDDDWGMDKLPSTLQEVDLVYLSATTCRNYKVGSEVAGWPMLRSNMMCAMDPNPLDYSDQDACQGDSGGPLMLKGSNPPIQVGIVSYGKGCGENHPGVYARISYERNWIKRTACELNPGAGYCDGVDDSSTTITISEPSPTAPPPSPAPPPPVPACGDTRDCSEIRSARIPSAHCAWDLIFEECNDTCCRCGNSPMCYK